MQGLKHAWTGPKFIGPSSRPARFDTVGARRGPRTPAILYDVSAAGGAVDRTTEPLSGTGRRRVPGLRGSWRWGRSLLSIAGVAALLVLVVPLVAGAPWGRSSPP